MSSEFKDQAASLILENFRQTEAYKFIQSLVRETVERIVNPSAAIRVKKLSDQALICHSMIYHFLLHAGYRAAAEMMQGECYEMFLPRSFLKENLIIYEDDAVEKSLETYKLKNEAVLKRDAPPPSNTVPVQVKITPKPDPKFEETKEKLRESIHRSSDEAVKQREELMQSDETVSEEDGDEEDEDEASSETKSSQSSTTTESEPEMVTSTWTKRLWGPNAQQLTTDTIIATPAQPSKKSQLPPLVASQLPPLTGLSAKPKITSIRSIDFDIPELEKSPSIQSLETPRASPTPVQPVSSGNSKKQEEHHSSPPMEAEELSDVSDIESVAGIDQLLESDRSGSISF